MREKIVYPKGVTEDTLKELVSFEVFFDRVGLKRIDGAIYGLLALSIDPLSSEEIQEILKLSQSAVSQSLKSLTQLGAIESRDIREKKIKVHFAKTDAMHIVASVFRKREQEMVQELKLTAQRILELDSSDSNLRAMRMKSIIATCEMAEAMMNFVITLSVFKNKDEYQAIIEKFPRALEFLLHAGEKTGLVKEKIFQGTNALVANIGKNLRSSVYKE